MDLSRLLKYLFFMVWISAFAMAVPVDNVTVSDMHSPQLGINCRGSSMCTGCSSLGYVKKMIDEQVPDNALFADHQYIACGGCGDIFFNKWAGLCVFTQKTKSRWVSGAWVKEKLAELRKKCNGCGSIPAYLGNDVNEGELTVNYVYKGCGNRVCP